MACTVCDDGDAIDSCYPSDIVTSPIFPAVSGPRSYFAARFRHQDPLDECKLEPVNDLVSI